MLPSQATIPGSGSVLDPTTMNGEALNTVGDISSNSKTGVNEADLVINLKPPDMINEASQFSLYEKRLKRWSRLSSLSKQRQFDLILSMVPPSNPLCEKLEEEIGDSTDAKENGVDVRKAEGMVWKTGRY